MSKLTPFVILPQSGYLNDKYQIIINSKELYEIIIYSGENQVKKINTKEKNFICIDEFSLPGEYIARCRVNENYFEQQIVVKNAFRLGSSVVSNISIFDESEYIFFCFKDRLAVFNLNQSYSYIQNHISPSKIYSLDTENYLFVTEFAEFSNIAIYSSVSHSIIYELIDKYQIIHFDQSGLILYLKLSESMELIKIYVLELIRDKTKGVLVKKFDDFFYNLNEKIIFLKSNDVVFLFNVESGDEYKWNCGEFSGIAKNGTIILVYENSISIRRLSDSYKTDVHVDFKFDSNVFLNNADYFWLNQKYCLNDVFEAEKAKIIEQHKPLDINKTANKFVKNNIGNNLSYRIAQFYSFDKKIVHIREDRDYYINSITYSVSESGEIVGIPALNIKSGYSLFTIQDNKMIEHFKYHLINFHFQFKRGVLLRCVKNKSTFRENYVFLGNEGNVEINGGISNIIISPNKEYIVVKKEVFSNENILDLDHPSTFLISNIKLLHSQEKSGTGKMWFLDFGDSERLKVLDIVSGIVLSKLSKEEFGGKINYSNITFKDGYFQYLNKYYTYDGELICDADRQEFIVSLKQFKAIKKHTNGYFIFYRQNLNSTFKEINYKIDTEYVKESYFVPNSRKVLINRTADLYELYDFETRSYTQLFSGKFLTFCGDDFIAYTENQQRNPVLFDPNTFKKIDVSDFKYYKFQSPDGRYFISTSHISKHCSLVDNNFITSSHFDELSKELNISNVKDEKEKESILVNIEKYFYRNQNRFLEIGVDSLEKYSFEKIFYLGHFLLITDIQSKEEYYLELPRGMQFYNYASFSFDSKYVSCVGCYNMSIGGGFFLFAKIEDLNNSNKIIKPFYIKRTSYATWVCGFSSNNMFASYDSTPVTYISFCNKLEDLNEGEIIQISNSSFLCFSPTGKYIALSKQGYDPISLSGTGHQKSSLIKVLSSETLKLAAIFDEHGDSIQNLHSKNIVSVMFSKDEKYLLSLSQDGVLVVRAVFTEDIPPLNSENKKYFLIS